MPNILTVLDASSQTHEVVLLERLGRRLRLQSPTSIAPGTAAQLRLEGELLLGEVTTSAPQCDRFELRLEVREVLRDVWHRCPAWSALDTEALDTEESVVGSLNALQANLVFHEMQWRVGRNRVK